MMPKELDCVLLKDGREVVILDDSIRALSCGSGKCGRDGRTAVYRNR